MTAESFHTDNLRRWLPDIHDRRTQDELLRACQGRLRALARKMIKHFPVVVRWSDVEEVLTGASLRLLRALATTPVPDTRGFFNLAAAIIRRELIDLARHFGGPRGIAANHDSVRAADTGHDNRPALDPSADETDPTELDRWTALHEAVDRLPADEREVFGLLFYHRWTQQEIADLFGWCDKTVSRKLKSAAKFLKRELGGELPAE